MSQVIITLPDGSSRAVSAGTPVGEIAASISPRLAKAALAAMVDDRLVDLTYPLQQDARVRIVTSDNPDALPLSPHSTPHPPPAPVTPPPPPLHSAPAPP